MDLFLKELDLEGVLSRVRRVFLLEAGDLMHQFCSNLFNQLEPGLDEEEADSASLTLTLQDTLASRYPSWADQFSVELQGNNLEGVTLHLRTQWPLTMVLNQVRTFSTEAERTTVEIILGQFLHIQLCLSIFGWCQAVTLSSSVHQVMSARHMLLPQNQIKLILI